MTKRNVVKNLTLSEISGVTVPAQSDAIVTIWKSDHPEIVEFAKYLSTADGAKSFTDFMAEATARERVDRIGCDLWPVTSALRDSLTSILADTTLSDSGKEEKIAESVAQFASTVNPTSQHPETGDSVTNELMKLLEDNDNMSEELVKKAEGLEAQVAELTKKLADAETVAKMGDGEKEYLAGLEKEEADKFKAMSAEDRKKAMKKSADTDEVFKSADGHEIRKSAVGDDIFAILKSQDEALKATREEMVKAAERAQTVEFTKRADEELANLPGETVAKVAVLKGIHGMDEAAQATLTAMLKAGNEALAKGFQSFGVAGGKPQDITKAAKREGLVKAHMEANPNVTKAQAEVAVLSAHPDLYEG